MFQFAAIWRRCLDATCYLQDLMVHASQQSTSQKYANNTNEGHIRAQKFISSL